MNQKFAFVAIAATVCGLTACVPATTTSTTSSVSTSTTSTTAASSASAAGSLLGNLIGSLFGSSLTEKDLHGTWTYNAPKVAFESENLLAKAGGTVAASQVESKLSTYLAKVGITAGTSTFTFNEDGTYSVGSKTKTLYSGNYTFDQQNKTIKMTGMLGLASFTASVGKSGSNIYLMFDADKVLSSATTITKLLGKSTIASILGNYEGMQMGFTLAK